MQVVVVGVVSFGHRDVVDGVAFVEVGLDVLGDVGEEAFSVFVEVDYYIRFRKIIGGFLKILYGDFRRFRTPRRFAIRHAEIRPSPLYERGQSPFIGEVAGVHEEVDVRKSEFFYFFYGLEVTEVEVGGFV